MSPRSRWLFWALCAASGCDEAPPGFIVGDGSVLDGSRPDGGDASASRSDAGPLLPDATRTVVLPFGAPATTLTYDIATVPSHFDLHVSMDTTSSFAEEIDALQTALISEILPAVQSGIPATSIGVSSFEDFPSAPFGGPDDRPFTLLTAITSSTSRVNTALAALDDPLGYGGDFPESGFEALYQIATGAGYRLGGTTLVPRATGTALEGGGDEGGVGFRPGSLRAVLHITDARSHGPLNYGTTYPGTHSASAAIDALRDERIKVIGVASGTIARDDLVGLALGTDAIMPPTNGACPTGVGGVTYPTVEGVCPLVFDVLSDGTGLSTTIISALRALVDAIQYDEVAFDLGDDRLGFVVYARAVDASVPPGVTLPSTADLDPIDGVPETFLDVHVGSTLHFELALRNTVLPELDYTQVFLVRVTIVADGTLLVDETIRIVVPARALPDAGFADADTADVGIE